MKLYYYYNGILLEVYDSDKKLLFEIPCIIGENVLIVIEDYIYENKLKLKFNELIPL